MKAFIQHTTVTSHEQPNLLDTTNTHVHEKVKQHILWDNAVTKSGITNTKRSSTVDLLVNTFCFCLFLRHSCRYWQLVHLQRPYKYWTCKISNFFKLLYSMVSRYIYIYSPSFCFKKLMNFEEHMNYVKKIPMNCKPVLIIYLLPPPSFFVLFCGLFLLLKYKITQTNFFTKSCKCYHVCFKRQFLDHVWRQNFSSTQLLIDPYLTQPYPKQRVREKITHMKIMTV